MDLGTWCYAEDFPPAIVPALKAFNRWFPLHHTNNVVRIGQPGHLCVQVGGSRVTPARLAALERDIGGLVEVEGLGNGYLLIHAWPGTEISEPVTGDESPDLGSFMYRPL